MTARGSKRPVGGEDDPYNIVGRHRRRDADLQSGPRGCRASSYLNEALLPFALSHKDAVCLPGRRGVLQFAAPSTAELQGAGQGKSIQ